MKYVLQFTDAFSLMFEHFREIFIVHIKTRAIIHYTY